MMILTGELATVSSKPLKNKNPMPKKPKTMTAMIADRVSKITLALENNGGLSTEN